MNQKQIITVLAACVVTAAATLSIGYLLGQQKGAEGERTRGETEAARVAKVEQERRDKDQAVIQDLKKSLEDERTLRKTEEDKRKREAELAAERERAAQQAAKLAAEREAERLRAEEAARKAANPYRGVKVVAVGLNYTGMPEYRQLQFAEQDAKRVADTLENQFGFTVKLLRGPAATKAAIEEAITSTLNSLGEEEDFLFYFAGHGIALPTTQVGRFGLLLPADAGPVANTEREVRRSRAIELIWLAEQLQKSEKGRHRLAILDACCSSLPKLPGVTIMSSDRLRDAVNPLRHRSAQMMSATAENQNTVELTDKNGGVFTSALIRQLEAVKEGVLPFQLLFNAVENDVLRNKTVKTVEGRLATPQWRSFIETEGDFVFMKPAGYEIWAQSQTVTSAFKIVAWSGPLEIKERDQLMERLGPPSATRETAKKSGFLKTISTVANVMKETPTTPPVTLPPAEVERFERLAARGDANAMVVLSTYYGRSADPELQKYAVALARRAYETGQPAGKLALGIAYYEGFDNQGDQALGAELIGRSGLSGIASWLPSVAMIVGGGWAVAKGKDTGTKVAGGIAVVAGAVNLLSMNKTVHGQFHDRLKEAKTALTGSKPDTEKTLKHVDAAVAELKADNRLDDEGKRPFVAAAETIRKHCTENNLPQAVQRIDEAIQTLTIF